MKKTILALAIVAGLASFAGNAKAAFIYDNTASFSITGGVIPSSTMPLIGFGNIFDIVQYQGRSGFPPFDPPVNASGRLDGQNPGQGALSINANLGDSIGYFTTGWNQQTRITSSGTNYFGISFQNNGFTNYGWLEATTTGYGTQTASPNFTLVAYAYDTTGASVTVGQTAAVPEPSTYALFGIGAIGMLMVLRRKKTA
jgi:hypothetical protein